MKSGTIGEVTVLLEFIKQGYEVYKPFTENTEYDLIVAKDGKIMTVEIKSTKTNKNKHGSYKIQLKKVRSNKSSNKITNFDNSKIDILAVHIEKEDTVLIFDAKTILAKTELSIKIK